MGFDNGIQFPADEDNCIYFYDEKLETWKKICDIPSPADLPPSVRRQIRTAQNEADQVLRLPL